MNSFGGGVRTRPARRAGAGKVAEHVRLLRGPDEDLQKLLKDLAEERKKDFIISCPASANADSAGRAHTFPRPNALKCARLGRHMG